MAVPTGVAGTAAVEGVEAQPVPGVHKIPCWVGKRFWDHFEAARKEKVKIPEVHARRLAAATRTVRLCVCCRASLEAADGDDLISGPDSDGEGVRSPAENSKGVVVEGLEQRDGAAAPYPDEAGGEQLGWQFVGQLGTRVVPGQRESGSIQSLRKNFNYSINRNFIPLQKFIGQHNWSTSAGERPVSSLNCAQRSRCAKGNSSAQVAATTRVRCASLRQRCSLSTTPFVSGW